MMKLTIIDPIYLFILLISLVGCSKTSNVGPGPSIDSVVKINYSDSTQALKTVTKIPLGVALSYQHWKNDATLREIAQENFEEFVFNSELKHGAILQSDGTFNFATADDFLEQTKDFKHYGHVLAWHRHQNTAYLDQLIGQFIQSELLTDPGFEVSTQLTGPHWNVLNSGNPKGDAVFTLSSEASEVSAGSKSLKLVNPQSYGSSDWRVQLASHSFKTTPGKKYNIKYKAKSASGTGIVMVSAQATDGSGTTHYPGGDKVIGTNWQTINLSFTATKEQYRIQVNMGKKADTYFLDDFSISPDESTLDQQLVYTKLDEALKTYISTVIDRYKNKIHKWEVVNEVFTDQGEIRNYSNSPVPIINGQKEYGYFLWSSYLNRNYGYLAFKYAKEADPTAELYINDYGLEYSDRKIDSLIAYVNEIKLKGAKVDGIGTQMHTDIYLTQERIDKMFQKLASTGLKVKVSELDIRITNSTTPVQPTEAQLIKQKEQYQRIVASYVKFVPPAQRGGITVWGVVDKYNWQYLNGSDYPNLFSVDYLKKPGYAGFLKGLEGSFKK